MDGGIAAEGTLPRGRRLGMCHALRKRQGCAPTGSTTKTRSPTAPTGSSPSELIREKLFRLTGDELPYTSTVVIDKFEEEGNLRRIAATIIVERDAHKGMVIGTDGERAQAHRLRDAPGTRAPDGLQGLPRAVGQGPFRAGPITRNTCAATATNKLVSQRAPALARCARRAPFRPRGLRAAPLRLERIQPRARRLHARVRAARPSIAKGAKRPYSQLRAGAAAVPAPARHARQADVGEAATRWRRAGEVQTCAPPNGRAARRC